MEERDRLQSPIPLHVQAWRNAAMERDIPVGKRWDGSTIYKSEQALLVESWMHRMWKITIAGRVLQANLSMFPQPGNLPIERSFWQSVNFLIQISRLKWETVQAHLSISSQISRALR
jgi:hypothetical protein